MFASPLLDLRERYATAPDALPRAKPAGQQPLYYNHTDSGSFAFASEGSKPPRLMFVPQRCRRTQSTAYLLFGGRRLGPVTLWNGFFPFPPWQSNAVARPGAAGAARARGPWWTFGSPAHLNRVKPRGSSVGGGKKVFGRFLEDAVRGHLIATAGGLFLSSGLTPARSRRSALRQRAESRAHTDVYVARPFDECIRAVGSEAIQTKQPTCLELRFGPCAAG